MQTRWKTNYLSHDEEYLRRRAAGSRGWYSDEVLSQYLDLLSRVFCAPHFPCKGKLLEVGCGAGDWSLWAAQRGYEAHGMDISPNAIAWAMEKSRERGLEAKFQVGNALELSGYDPEAFDIVLDGHCFHCIAGGDRKRFLRAVFRVLKPHGIFHVNTMCGTPSCDEFLQHYDSASRCLIREGIAIRYLGLPESVEQEVAEAGFLVVSRKILPRRNDRELDLLLLDLTKP
jgi:ubiquinone/menaquinone biosynthesis C-methylase UbiE